MHIVCTCYMYCFELVEIYNWMDDLIDEYNDKPKVEKIKVSRSYHGVPLYVLKVYILVYT